MNYNKYKDYRKKRIMKKVKKLYFKGKSMEDIKKEMKADLEEYKVKIE